MLQETQLNRGLKATVAVALIVGLLTACEDAGNASGDGDAGAPAGKPPTEVALRVPATVPAGYDGTKGWQTGLSWLGNGTLGHRTPVDTAPRSGLVALLQQEGEKYVVEARDVSSGSLLFRSRVLDTPQEPEQEENEREIPGVEVVTQGGEEYITVWAHGFRGKDAVRDGEEVVSVAVFPTSARGKDVAPARTADIPVDHQDITRLGGRRMTDFVTARDGGAGLLVTWTPEDEGEVAASLDVVTGDVRRYASTHEEPGCEKVSCQGTWVEALSGNGPVRSGDGAFGVAGRWDFTQHVPKDATKDDLGHYGAEILASESGHVVAAWNSYLGDESPADIEEFRVWAVHNAATGAVEATVRCGEQVWRSIDGEDRPTSLSPNGRYLTAGFVAFDLEQGTGHCLLGKEGQKDVQAVSVDDDGTVYGLAGLLNESERAYATVSMATGKANALPAGADLPLHMLPDAAVFYPPADGGGLLPTVHPRA